MVRGCTADDGMKRGGAMVYLASSRAMAVMELLVHLRPEDLQRPYTIAVFDVPDDKILKIAIDELPKDWQSEKRIPYLRRIASEFVAKGKYLMMEVPSVLIEEERNYILNPLHSDAAKIKLVSQRSFGFDHRLKG